MRTAIRFVYPPLFQPLTESWLMIEKLPVAVGCYRSIHAAAAAVKAGKLLFQTLDMLAICVGDLTVE